jgi:dephospho-CoA kinase
MLIGLTGGIATGKSTVSRLFAQRGATIIDADKIARQVVEPGTVGAAQVRQRFGAEVFDDRGQLNRSKLGQLIFADETARQDLNQLLHPLIRQESRRQTEQIQQATPNQLIIWDVPLLYEGKLQTQVENVVVVYVPQRVQIERLMQRDQLSEQEAHARIAAQMPIEQKKSLADYVIDNSGSYEQTERQVDQLWNSLNKD